MIERGFIGTENAKLGPKGMKLFHSFSKTAFEFQILILKLMSHQLRYTVIGQMSYQFRCIYCNSSKMMTHFIKNFIKLRFSIQDQDLPGFLKRSTVSPYNKVHVLKSLSGSFWFFIEKPESPCKLRNPLATLSMSHFVIRHLLIRLIYSSWWFIYEMMIRPLPMTLTSANNFSSIWRHNCNQIIFTTDSEKTTTRWPRATKKTAKIGFHLNNI